jgi:hypothetical protein
MRRESACGRVPVMRLRSRQDSAQFGTYSRCSRERRFFYGLFQEVLGLGAFMNLFYPHFVDVVDLVHKCTRFRAMEHENRWTGAFLHQFFIFSRVGAK